MKAELISKLEELLTKDAGEVATNVRTLQKEYQKLWTIEFEKSKQEFIDDGGKANQFEYPKQSEDIYFEGLIEKYNKLKKESDLKIANEQAKNLVIRQEIVSKINDLTKLSDNVGAAVKMLQELQTQWREAGQVSTHKYKEIQSDYSKAVEEFHYNLKIYRDLQEHDLKKNFEHKTELIEKLKALQLLENIKEAERLLKIYRNEWEEIGPVPNDKWEVLKTHYKVALDDTYAKIKSYYNAIEEKKENNLKIKLELIEKANALLTKVSEDTSTKWNEATEQMISLQEDWKTTGRTSEKDNEKIWNEFRLICDNFFEKKKEFFANLNEKFAENRKLKNELIAKAQALQTSTDWQKTSKDLIKLQETWKKHPSNGDKEEPKLFNRFRKACNAFFDARKAHFENLDASYENNLKVKEEILGRFNAFTLSDDVNANREHLKNFATEFNNANMVPLKDKKRINDSFYSRLDELYNQLNVDKQEKAVIQFKNKIERFVASENAFDLLRKEADYIKKLVDEINSNIRTYENNLGFFKTSKGSNAFMKEIEAKVEVEKAKLNELTVKRKLINDELSKIREASNKPKVEA
jgi:hypothetical protein